MMSAEVQRGHRAHFEVSRVNASEFFSSLLVRYAGDLPEAAGCRKLHTNAIRGYRDALP
jgi:hypothetical protein